MTLEANSTLLYLMDEEHDPQAASGIAWNDPSLGIKWPFKPSVLSDKDATWSKLNLE
jgi:dTDP-4-dehydrorhamnose 3,5-epimerase